MKAYPVIKTNTLKRQEYKMLALVLIVICTVDYLLGMVP